MPTKAADKSLERVYWLTLFTGKTWQEFLENGASVVGYRSNRWHHVKQMKAGDSLICYLTGVSRFIGILDVISQPYKDSLQIWQIDEMPCRVDVQIRMALTPETAVPVSTLKDKLSLFKNLRNERAWGMKFKASGQRWSDPDAKIVVNAIKKALDSPIIRPVDAKILSRKVYYLIPRDKSSG